tara:strand:- start:225 stop:554 length:330 start_codon:yes stop_codon:yes gene_type:complete
MALIVGGTTVTGTQTLDATTLTGNLPAISGASLTNLPAASSIPAVSYNTVGSFSFIRRIVGNTSAGATTSSYLRFTNSSVSDQGTPSGTWRNMTGFLLEGVAGVWQRAS